NAPITITLTNQFGAVASPPGPFNGTTDAAGQFSATFTSATPGQVSGSATATVMVGGQPVIVTTNGLNGNSGPAVKTFVDANIQINPQNATNQVGSNHVLTVHVNVNAGLGGGYVNAPAGTLVTGTIVSGPGSFVGGNTCTTIGATGDCQLTITSSTTGTTVVKAATDVVVGGVSLHRETGDGLPGDSPN